MREPAGGAAIVAEAQRWGWTALRFGIACCLTAALLAPFARLASTFYLQFLQGEQWVEAQLAEAVGKSVTRTDSSSDPWGDLDKLLPQQGPPIPATDVLIRRRVLTVDVDATGIALRYDLELDKASPLLGALQRAAATVRGRWESIPSKLAGMVGHFVDVQNRTVVFESVHFQIDANESTAHMQLVADRQPFDELFDDTDLSHALITILPFSRVRGASEIIVHTTDVHILARTVTPIAQTLESTIFRDDSETGAVVAFDLVLPKRPSAPSAPTPITSALRHFQARYIPVLQPLFLGSLYSIPFLLLLALGSDPLLCEDGNRLDRFEIVALIVLLLLGSAILRACLDLAWYLPKVLRAAEIGVPRGMPPQQCFGAVALLFVAWLWPGLSRLREAKAASRLSLPVEDGRAQWIVPISALFATMVFLASRLLDVDRSEYQDFALDLTAKRDFGELTLTYAPALLAFAAACCWLAYEVGYRHSCVRRGLALMVLLLGYIVLDQITVEHALLRRAWVIVLVIPFLFGAARLVYPLIAPRTFRAWWKEHGRLQRSVIVGVAVLVLLPLLRGWGGGSAPAWWVVPSFVWTLGPLWSVALLIALLPLLRAGGGNPSDVPLPETGRELGIVLALAFCFPVADHWMQLPVIYLLGYVAVRRWLFVPQTARAADDKGDVLRQSIRGLIDLRDADRALRQLKKESLAKLGRGDIVYDDYTTKIGALELKVEAMRQAYASAGAERTTALAYGPDITPWERALRGTAYGAAFAIPWMALYVQTILASEAPSAPEQWISLVGSAVLAIAQWPLRGLFFGYFYPALRGANGLQKGLHFFIVLIVPALVAQLLLNPATGTSWATLLLLSLPLFIHCMLLGLIAGDYDTLRRASLSWRHLIDIHDLAPLTAWGSSIMVAVGAAVATWASSGAASLVTSGLKALLPPETQFPK